MRKTGIFLLVIATMLIGCTNKTAQCECDKDVCPTCNQDGQTCEKPDISILRDADNGVNQNFDINIIYDMETETTDLEPEKRDLSISDLDVENNDLEPEDDTGNHQHLDTDNYDANSGTDIASDLSHPVNDIWIQDINETDVIPDQGFDQGQEINPPLEICDGIDNNGDEETDEDFPEKNTICIEPEINFGCLQRGKYTCSYGQLTCEFEDVNIPYNFSVKSSTCNQNILSWSDESNDMTGFIIQRKAENEEYQDIARVEANIRTYIDNDVQPNTSYSYMIRAEGQEGDSRCIGGITTLTANVATETIVVFNNSKENMGDVIAARDSNSNYHIAFCNPDDSHTLYYTSNESGQWSTADLDRACANPSIAIDQNNKANLLNFEECGGGTDPDLYFLTNQNESWESELIDWFVWTSCTGYNNIAFFNNQLSFVYRNDRDIFGDGTIRYVTGNEGNWQNNSVTDEHAVLPGLFLDQNETPYVILDIFNEDTFEWRKKIVRLINGAWEEVIANVLDNIFFGSNVELIFDQENNLHIMSYRQHAWFDDEWNTEDIPMHEYCHFQYGPDNEIHALCDDYSNTIYYFAEQNRWQQISLGSISGNIFFRPQGEIDVIGMTKHSLVKLRNSKIQKNTRSLRTICTFFYLQKI